MHSRLEILMICPDESRARSLCLKAEETALGLEKIFDRHKEGCCVYELNRDRSAEGVAEELFFALELCEKFRQMSCGCFDIASLGESRHRPAYGMMPEGRGVMLAEGVTLDFGGFAKGYALEVIRKSLADEGIVNALLNFGDSSVVGMGRHPFGDCWQLRPEEGGRTFRLKDSALSTSGASRDGRSHIVCPLSGEAVPAGVNVSVEGHSALVCEVLSTALYAAPKAMEKKIMESFEGYKVYYGS